MNGGGGGVCVLKLTWIYVMVCVVFCCEEIRTEKGAREKMRNVRDTSARNVGACVQKKEKACGSA